MAWRPASHADVRPRTSARFPVHSAIRLRIIAACVIGAVAGAGRLAYLVEYPKRR
jgi:hypothetical protein